MQEKMSELINWIRSIIPKTGETVLSSGEEGAYLVDYKIVKVIKYNPKYGDERVCTCGHSYYRHFDTYEAMAVVGCKYCQCYEFVEEKIKIGDEVKIVSNDITKDKIGKVVENDPKDNFRVTFGDGWHGYYMLNEIKKVQ